MYSWLDKNANTSLREHSFDGAIIGQSKDYRKIDNLDISKGHMGHSAVFYFH